MKEIKEELHRRWRLHRQSSAGKWSSLIVRIALLALVIWLMLHYKSGIEKFQQIHQHAKKTIEQPKETP
ncbi:MAG TPA: hypothetical protein PLE74_00125 [Candidatus Cloacimonadota bacterium]|nr:hypothetical protein [Candidatus Cloacimonadota bacterium]HPT70665.1 hypothetical protein [Candidatus Cloacimonadota bacterium]